MLLATHTKGSATQYATLAIPLDFIRHYDLYLPAYLEVYFTLGLAVEVTADFTYKYHRAVMG